MWFFPGRDDAPSGGTKGVGKLAVSNFSDLKDVGEKHLLELECVDIPGAGITVK
jgi:hypothetical protein